MAFGKRVQGGFRGLSGFVAEGEMRLEKIPPTLPGQDYGLLARGENMIGARLFQSRKILAAHCFGILDPGPICCEIGVLNGDFSKFIFNVFGPSKIYLVDLIVRSKVREMLPGAIILEGDSSQVIQFVPDGTIDYLYVDGDHTYDGICKDIRAAWPKVKPGGIIQFN